MKNNKIAEPLSSLANWNSFIHTYTKEKSGAVVGTIDHIKAQVMQAVANEIAINPIIIASTEQEAKVLHEDLKYLYDEHKVYLYPSRDILFYNADVHSTDITAERIRILNEIIQHKDVIVITTVEALLNPLSTKETFIKYTTKLSVGETLDIDTITKYLMKVGYERATKVEAIGQFAVRGGILDIFSPINILPVRIELFDDEIDSIRRFSSLTQRSIDKIENINIYPNQEVIVEGLKNSIPIIKEDLDKVIKRLRLENKKEAAARLSDNVQEDIEFILEDISSKGLELYTPYTKTKTITLLDYFPKQTPIFISETQKCQDRLERVFYEYEESIKDRLEYGHILTMQTGFIFDPNRITAEIFSRPYISFINFENTVDTSNIINIPSEMYELVEPKQAPKRKKSNRKKYQGAKIESFLELLPGDYVVHEMHGIGVFQGIEQIVIEGISRDNLKIQYANDSLLYVHINQMDMVQKYVGSEGSAPKLSNLGTPEWKKSKAKVKGAVANIAKELISLYSKRENQRGFMYGEDTMSQQEFEQNFPYTETDDQLDAISAVKTDMESDKIMDRLICGDVGYGKTEVAIRAAFKAVMNSKQVAYLVPTTILAQQHYERFVERMEENGIHVGLLSRFRTPNPLLRLLSTDRQREWWDAVYSLIHKQAA